MASKGNKIKIGVLGCADIAKRSFIPAIKELETLFDLVAVSSRTIKKANEFIKNYKISGKWTGKFFIKRLISRMFKNKFKI